MSTLRAIRKAAGLSQIQLAQRAHISRFRLSLAETESIELRPDELASISSAIDPEMEEIARIAAGFKQALKRQKASGVCHRIEKH
jgi:transcriptional regulator with XRE-family HTH domain